MADITNVPELVDATVYPLMLEKYEGMPRVFPLLGEVNSIPASGAPYGFKGSVITNVERPKEVLDGEESPATDIKTGYTWQCKIREFSRRIDIPNRMLESSDAAGKVRGLLSEIALGWGEVFSLTKEDFIADMFQAGTLTAAQYKWFDNTFPNEADPDKGFIYDGLPWFDTAHTLAGSATTKSNHNTSSALTSANLGTALDVMRVTNAVNEMGERIAISPDLLLVPAGSMGRTARTIINSSLLPGTAQNDTNTLNGELQVLEWAHLDDSASSSAWWLVQRQRGLKIWDSGAPTIQTQYDALRRQWFVVATSFFGATVTNWRYHYCANKAAS